MTFFDLPSALDHADITFVPVKNGFLYLVAIMDWATRKVLSCGEAHLTSPMKGETATNERTT